MKKRNLLILILTMLIIFLTIGVSNQTYGACVKCKQGNHTSCTSPTYKQLSSGHAKYCCCNSSFAMATAAHSVSSYVNTASTCYRCVCGYTEGHNTSGGYCPNAHCEYNSKPRCSRGCSHAKWTSCRGHSYSSTWSTDASNHWKVCTVVSSCSSVSSKAAHADTNNDGSCDTCGYAMVVATKVSKPTAPTRNFTYTGSAQSIGLSGYDSSIMSLSGGTATNAGNYIATISLRDATSYQWSDGTTSSVSFSWSISRASISVPTASNYIYDGSQKTGVSSGTGYTISGTNTATNVALYTVTVTPDSNHQWSDGTTSAKNLEWAIMARTISIPTGRTYTYDGTTKTGVSSGTGYTLSGTTTASAVGTYIVYASLLSNYAWSDGSMEDKTIYWYIENATVTDYSPTVTLSTTNGTSATITATLRDSEGLAGYAFTYSSSTPSSWTSISGTYRTVSRSYEETGYIYVWVKDTAGQTSYDRVYIEKVTYDANGGSGAPSTEYKVDGTSISISTTKPTKSGYTFKEWNTKSDGTGTSYAPGATYSTNTSLSLYAIYEQDTPVDSLPTITYSTTNGIAVYFTATLADVEGLAGYAWTTTSTAPTTWTSISGTSQLITKTFQTTGAQYIWVKDTAGQTTNKQIWIESLTYDANGGTGAPSPEYKVDGTSIQISNTTPTKEGYLFKEWNTISAGTGTSYLPGATYSSDNSLTLYAIYRSEDEIDGPNDATVYEGQTAKFTVTGAKAVSKYKWYQVRNSVTTEVSQMYKSNIEGKANATASATITLNTTVSGKISFDYKVSSEANYDKFTVKVNSTTVASAISGAGNWISYGPTTYIPTNGKITITLTYTKDGSLDKNDDCGYIRNIKFVTDANPDGDVDGIITYTSSTFGFTGADGSKATLKIPNTTTSMSGNQYYCVVTDTNGEVQTSRSGTLTVNEDTRPTLMTREHKFLTASGVETESYVNAATRIWYAIGARRAGKEQYTSEKIRTIQILDTNVTSAPTSYVATWDASASKNGTINVYLKTSTEDSTLYDMYICAAGGIKATDATWLFGAYENCISINGMELVDIGSATIANALFMNNKKMKYVDVSNFDTSNLVDMTYMFSECESLESIDVSNFDTSNATDMTQLFKSCKSLKKLDVSNFNTSKVTSMDAMFYECSELTTLDVRNFDTSKVTNMANMFCLCEKVKEIELSSLFNTANVTRMDAMFARCYQLENVDISGFDTSKVTDMGVMFYLCHELKVIDVSEFNTTNVTNMRGMFTECWKVETLDVSNFNTAKVTDMAYMFHTCRKVSVIDVSKFVTSKVTDMECMFMGCAGITELNVSGFTTSNVTLFAHMFNGCENVKTLDVSKFNTAKATTMGWMFSECYSLESLNVSSFSTTNVTNMEAMFEMCNGLKSLDLSNFNTSKVTSMDRIFTDSVNLESILLGSSFNKLNGENMFGGCTALKAIISERQTSSSIAAPTLTTNIGINGEAIFYVPNTTALTYTKSATNYSTVFGTDRIHRILELIGTSPMTSPLGVIFNDPGVTVAGMEKTVIGTSTTYTPYNYTVTISGLTRAPTTTGNQYRTYTLKKGTTTIDSIRRTVNVVSMGKLMARESGISGTENYAIGAKRAGKTQYTGDKIKTITLQASLTAPTGYVDTWDASYSQNGTVKAWVVTNAEDTTMYDLYIGANNGIIAPSDGYMLFAFYTKCTKINNLNLLNTSATTSMRGFFYRLYVLESLDLSNFSMSSCTNAWDMFSDCQALTTLDLSNFDTSKLIYATYMFYGCKNVTNINLENFNTSNVTNTSGMFYNCQKLASLDVSNFNTSNVTGMGSMFWGCSSLTSLDVSNFNTSNVTNMEFMFYNCNSLTSLDVSGFDTSKVTTMYWMFVLCEGLTTLDVSNFNTSNVTNMSYMFSNCSSLTSLDVSKFDTSKVTYMDFMFASCSSLTSLDVRNFNTSNVTNMGGMFTECSGLLSIDVKNFDTSNVTNMEFMFYKCSNLSSLELSSFDTSKVTTMYWMFAECKGLTALEVSIFDTSNLTNMDYMFYLCSNLTSLKLGKNFDKLTGADMFSDCSNLKAIITPRTTIMTLNNNTTTNTGLKILPNAILYVPTIAAETTFEAYANYADIFGADRIRPILELIGDNPVKVSRGATYVDSGVTVAGMTKNADGLAYTPYGYTVSGPVIKKDGTVVSNIDTSNVGTYTLTYTVHEPNISVDGMSVTREVKVENKDISENNPNITVSIPTEDRVYKDAAYTPVVTVKDGTTTLVEGTDYSVTYSNNIDAGTATITIKGINNYAGTRTENFEITQRPVTLKPKDASKVYDTLPLTSNVAEVTAGSLVSGHTATITTTGNITNVGTTSNKIDTYKITVKSTSEDVTKNYDVTTLDGTLKVTPATITGSVTITGTNTYGQTLTASVTANPTGCTLTYNWYYSTSATATSGTSMGTGSTVMLNDTAYLGKYVFVTVTASKANYNNATFSDRTDSANNGSDIVKDSSIVITTNPSNLAVKEGVAGNFSVVATGTNLKYQWYKATSTTGVGTVITGATGATYSITAANMVRGLNGSYYYCTVSNGAGSATSTRALLTVYYAPSIKTQPTDQSVNVGTKATFTIVANAGNPSTTTYKWQYRTSSTGAWADCTTTQGTGMTTSSFTTVATTMAMNGYQYRCIIGNAQYSSAATSNAATLTVNKLDITPTVNMTGYTYGGTKNNPTISGNTGNGEVTYYYNTTNSNTNGTLWSTVASSTSLNVGTYYMYAVVSATTNYNGATTSAVPFAITKRAITVKANDASKEYDTLPLTNNTYTVTSGSVAQNQEMTVTIEGTITKVGSVPNTITNIIIKDESGNYVTTNYDITKVNGTLTITAAGSVDFDVTLDNETFEYDGTEKEPGVTVKVGTATLEEGKDYDVSYKDNKDAGTATITIIGKGNYEGSITTKEFTITKRKITIVAFNASKTYDGIPLTSSKFEISPGTLAPDQTISVTTSGSITNVGTEINKISTYAIYMNSENVTKNYDVTTKDGKLEVLPASITGTVTITGTNKVGSTLVALVNVTPADADLTYSWYYNNTNSTNGGTLIVTETEGKYVIGSNTSVDLVGKYIYVVVTATKDNHKTQTFTDITDKDTNGSDTVRRVITSFDVTLDNDKFEYDGTPKTPNVTVKAENTELVEGTDYELIYDNNKDAGTATITIKGKGEYEDIIQTETFEISKIKLEITAGSKVKAYDGTPLTFSEVKVTLGTLAAGQTLTATTSGSITEVGTTENVIVSYSIYAGTEDVTKNYEVTTKSGTLEVTNAKIYGSVEITGITKVSEVLVANTINVNPVGCTYEYKWYYNDAKEMTGGTLITGANERRFTVTEDLIGKYIYVEVTASKTGYGAETFKDITDTVISKAGSTENPGSGETEVDVKRRPITIKLVDKEKVYDGTPLTSNEFIVSSGELVLGDTATVTASGEQTQNGSSTNEIVSVVIKNVGGEDVTEKYVITKENGTLTVKSKGDAIFNITLDEDAFEYDDTAKEPKVTVVSDGKTLTEGVDYTLTYENNVDAGTATIRITGIGNYEGSKGSKDFTITKRKVTVTAGSAKKVYDGTPLTSAEVKVTSGDLVAGHILVATTAGSITNVGSVPNKVYTYKITKQGKDVTTNYDVTNLDGTLEVTEATITGSVTIIGTNRVEETLTANVTVVPNDCKLEYAWYYSDTNATENGTLISTLATNQLLLTEEYLDKYIYVVVKASKDNYKDAEFRDITDADENEVPKVGERLESILMTREDDAYVIGAKRAGKTEYKSEIIKTINFINLRVASAPTDFVATWDVSKDQNGKVTAWLVKNSADSTKYDLYIGGKDNVKASDGYKLFSNYANLISINGMDVFNTSLVTNMGYMFNGDINLTSLDLQKFDTELVTNMSYMFNNCKVLQTLNVTYLDTSKVTDMAYMFGGMNKLDSIDVTGFVTANVTNMSGMFSNCSSLSSLDFSKFNTAKVTDMSNMFSGMSKLTEIDLANFTTSEVTNMSGMFKDNSKLTYLDLDSFDTSKVSNMNELLSGNTSLKTIHLGKNFNKVNGENMFANANSLVTIIAANGTPMTLTSNVNVNGNAILYVPDLTAETAYEADINYLNVFGKNRIKPMLALIGNNPANISINRLYTDDGITVAGYEDANAIEYTRYGYKLEVSGLPVDTSTLGTNTITYTLKDRNDEVVMIITRTVIVNEGPILMAREDVAYAIGAKRANKLTYTSDKIRTITFIDTTQDNIPTTYLDTWDVSRDLNTSVTAWITRSTQDSSMYDLYIGGDQGVMASSGNKLFMDYTNLVSINNISRLDASSVTDMSYMFANDKKLPSVDISRFTTTKVTDMSFMFKECNTFTTLDVTKLDTSSVTNMESMFEGCSSLTALNVSGFTTTNVLNMKNMFKNVSGITSLTFTNWDTSKVRNMSGLFDGCTKLTSVDLAKLITPSVTDMSAMFRNCSSITELDVTKFDTSSVTNMSNMFANVRRVSKLDVSGFNTSNVTDMNNMFSNMTYIQALDLTSFKVKAGTDVTEMFDGMNSMEILVLGTDFNVLDGTNMFKGCNNLTTIITKKNISSENNAMTLSQDININQNTILYVPNKTAESYFEKATNYEAVFGANRIRAILELIGDESVKVVRNSTYTDVGAKVAGFTKSDESKYTSLGYELLGAEVTKDGKSISKVDTTVPGTYLVKYTLRLNGTTVMNVTRNVEVMQLTASLVLSRYDLTIVEGNTETVTYTYSGDGTLSVTTIASIASAVLKQGSIAITGVSIGNAKVIVKATGIIYDDVTAEINVTVVKANYSITDKDGNKTNYNTLQDAVNGAESGDTIKVINDVKETGEIVIDKDVTIDLEDKTITIDTPIKIENGSNVNIIGSGDGENVGTIENPDGTAIVNNGNLTIGENTGKDVEDKPHIIGKDTAVDSKDGNTKIESGTLTGKDEPPYKGNIEAPEGYYIETKENGDKFDSVVKKDSTPPTIYGQTLDKILMNAGDTIRFFVYVEDKESGINTDEFTADDLIFEVDGNKVTPKDVKLEYIGQDEKNIYKYRLAFSGITSDGELVIRVDKDKVFNKARLGNLETIISQNIISIDSTGPNVSNAIFELIRPEDGTTYDGEFEAKLSNVYDRYGIKRYEWQVKEEGTFAYKTLTIEESSDTSSFYAGTLDKEGTYLIRVAVTDNNGNRSYTKDLTIIYGKNAGYNAKPTISFEKEVIRSGGKVIEVNIHAIVKSTTNLVFASVNDSEISIGNNITVEGKWQIRTEITYKAYANTIYKFTVKDENENITTKVYNVNDIARDAASISYKIYDATSFGKARIVFTAEEEVRLTENISDRYTVDDIYLTTYRKEITVFVKGDTYSIDDTFVFSNKIGNETPVHVMGDIDSNNKNIITVKNPVSKLTEVYGGEITLNRAENLVRKMRNARVSTNGNITSYYGLSFAQIEAKVTTEKEFTAVSTLATANKFQMANADGSISNIPAGKVSIITPAESDSSATNGNRTGIYMREAKIITGRESADEDGSKKGNSFHITIINK